MSQEQPLPFVYQFAAGGWTHADEAIFPIFGGMRWLTSQLIGAIAGVSEACLARPEL